MTLSPISWPTSLVTQKLKTAQLVSHVVAHSPASQMGIRAGWMILGVDGDVAENERILAAFAQPAGEIVFYDPADQALYGLHNCEVPLGFDVGPILNEDYGLEFRVCRAPAHEFLLPWAAGGIDAYGAFQKDFEVALRPLMQNVFSGFVSKNKQRDAMLAKDDATSKLGLALCYLAQDKFDQAGLFVDAYTVNLDANGGRAMAICLAAADYIFARVLQNAGDLETAQSYIETAAEHYPRAIPVQELYLELTGEPLASPPQVDGAPQFADYELNCYDPYNIWPDAGTGSLANAVSFLGDGDYGLVCLMADYRSNGPFVQDLSRLLSIQRAGTNAPSFVHVVSEFKGDPQTPHAVHWAANELGLKELGLKLSVLFDHEGKIARARHITGAPTWYVIDKDKQILGQGMLPDDAIIQAIY